MTGNGPRRDNGLQADAYVRLTEVAAHLAGGLLDQLGAEGIAAYTAPGAGRRGAYGDTVLPATPAAGLWVDRDREGDARAVLGDFLDAAESDLAFARIVALFDQAPADDPVPRWPVSEDVDDTDARADEEPAAPTPPATPPSGDVSYAERDDHFVPPPPPPIPRPDTLGRFAWAAAAGGPLLLILAALTGIGLPTWAGALGVAAFVGGFVTLVARMQDRRPDSDPDDGAVV